MHETDQRPQDVASNGDVVATPAEGPARREAIARRAYEISLSPSGATMEENWRRAEAEFRASSQS
jgi:hypothetical protein